MARAVNAAADVIHRAQVNGTQTATGLAIALESAQLRPAGTNLSFDWIEDEDDGVAELVVVAGQNEESATGYVVEALEVASKYDPEADQ